MKKNKHTGFKILLIFILFITIIYLYARYLNPSSFKINEVAIYDSNLNEAYHGLKIVQLSDTHYGRTTTMDNIKKVVKEINKLNPDIVIFTGDLLDNKNIKEEEKQELIKNFQNINAKLFKFAVIGDYDATYESTYEEILNKSSFTLLNNTNKLVYYNSTTPLNFIGLTNTNDIKDLYNNDYYNITLIHKPDYIKDITNTNLAFAGHSLGGQIRLPFIGSLRKTEGASTYIDSYYEINDTKLYISNGIGTEKYSLRMFNTPSITLYRLYTN